ncbi:MAG: VRR-NUC domain-containing protein [Bacteroidales bacterium]|nr:VRR-NUC domain-containing protein [Bacteroidales bacterium]
MTQEEHNIQAACVRWFGYAHPELRGLLFSVPNGGARSKATAGRLKAEGVVAGVSDLILLVPCCRAKITENNAAEIEIRHALCIEMKTAKGRQSPEQKIWQRLVEEHGYKYAVCRSLDEFIDTVEAYLR